MAFNRGAMIGKKQKEEARGGLRRHFNCMEGEPWWGRRKAGGRGEERGRGMAGLGSVGTKAGGR